MSNYHVLQTDKKLRSAQVVFHIEIPEENNSAGVSLRLASFQSLRSSPVKSVIPGFQEEFAAEYAQLQTGEIREYSKKVIFTNAHASNAAKQTELDNTYTALVVSVLAEFRAILRFWGKNRNVPV